MIDKPELETLGYKPNNTPNKNIVIVQKIQGLVAQIWDELFKTTAETGKQKAALSICKDEINTYEKVTLHELQESFE